MKTFSDKLDSNHIATNSEDLEDEVIKAITNKKPSIKKTIQNIHNKLPVSEAFRKTCYKCGNLGHHADECEHEERLCYNCKKPGHESSECPEARNAEAKQCYYCKEIGHIQSDCPEFKKGRHKQQQQFPQTQYIRGAPPVFQIPPSDRYMNRYYPQPLPQPNPQLPYLANPYNTYYQIYNNRQFQASYNRAYHPEIQNCNQITPPPTQRTQFQSRIYREPFIPSLPQISPYTVSQLSQQFVSPVHQYANSLQRLRNYQSEINLRRFAPRCYSCGEVGHESKNCPNP